MLPRWWALLYRPDDSRRGCGFHHFLHGYQYRRRRRALVVRLARTNLRLAAMDSAWRASACWRGCSFSLRGQPLLLGHAEPPNAAWLRQPVVARLSRETAIYLATIGLVLMVWLIMNRRDSHRPHAGRVRHDHRHRDPVLRIRSLHAAGARPTAGVRDAARIHDCLLGPL